MIFSLGQLLLPLADLLVIAFAECKTGIWTMNPDRMNTRLIGYKIRTFNNISPIICFDKCIRRPRCNSYNYNRHILRCELNYKPKPGFVENFQNEVGFVYVDVNHYRGDPMYDTCLGNPCNPGEVCETKKDRNVFCVKDQENMQVGDCTEWFEFKRKSGIYTIYPSKSDEGVKVFCNMTNGGWTVIQKRIDGKENFNRTWVEYKNGFGDLQHEFWLGNKYLHLLTNSGSYKLRVELVPSNGANVYAEYSNFVVGDAASSYRLTATGYSGNAGNCMASGYRFSTYDRDNDGYVYYCMVAYSQSSGAGWYFPCRNVDLNNMRWGSIIFVKSVMMIQRM